MLISTTAIAKGHDVFVQSYIYCRYPKRAFLQYFSVKVIRKLRNLNFIIGMEEGEFGNSREDLAALEKD